MKYKRYIFPVLMGFTMSNIMFLVNTGKIMFPDIMIMMILQAVVASAASLVFPAGLIGAKMTKKLFPRLNRIGFLIVSSMLPAIYFTSILSITGLLRMKGYSEGFWMSYFGSLSTSIVYGYVVSILWNVALDKLLQRKEMSK